MVTDTRGRLMDAILRSGRQAGARIARVPRGERLELSYGQRRLWFLDRLTPGNPFYNTLLGWRLRGRLDVAALAWALSQVVARHEVLRTRYEEADGDVWQVVEPAGEVRLAVEPCASEAEVAAASRQESEQGFDLALGPVIRGRLLRLDDEEHVLLVTAHHVAMDGWSLGIVARELGALYCARVRGEDAGLEELEIQYPDYAAWQRKSLEDGGLERQLAYWRERLSGMPGALEVPPDRARPAVASFRGGVVTFDLSPDLMDGLRKLSREHGASLYMTLLGGWQALLSRYAGTGDVVVGSPITNRTRRELEGLVGFFVNTLVMRTELGDDPRLEEVVERARETALGAYENAELPFEQLVEELNPERDLSRNPLVQVTFQLISAPGQGHGGLRLDGVVVSGAGEGSATARFDLELNVEESGWGWLMYAEELYEPESAERLMKHWRRVLEAMVAEPGRRLSEVELLDGEERERLAGWNRTAVEHERERCVHELFEEEARRRPGELALVAGGEEVRYEELNARSNRLARRLRELGVGPEARVGLCLERGTEMVVGLLGVLKAGGAYVPLDPDYPPERLSYLESDAGVSVLLTPEWLEAEAAAIAAQPGDDLEPWAAPGNLAYVIYTSGSTGRPKGVRVGHRALANFLRSMAGRPGLGPDDTLLAVTTVAFDIAGLELFLPLVTGGRVVVADRETAMDAALLARALVAHRATAMQATPATWRMLLDAGWAGVPGFKALCGGEALGADLARGLLEGGVELWNLYGPTETTVWSSVERVEDWSGITIGRPIANTRLVVVDRWLRPAPVGVLGELCIGGVGLAAGYHGRPGLTAERFVPDPTAAGSGERLYRTGDLARWRRNGKVEHLGRLDEQVKVRGFRVEPGEVEARLLEHPEVTEAVVVQRRDRAGIGRLVAYLVCGTAPGVSELRGHLRERLPEHMVPAQFVVLPALPRTLNGKVDRRRLPAPAPERPELGALVAPRTATEAAIAAIWRDLLGLPELGVDDDFFELGGDSMLAVRVAGRVLAALDVAVGVKAIFQQPTVAGLARVVDSSPPALHGDATSATGVAELPPSVSWIFRGGRPAHTNLSALFEVPADVDQEALQGAVDALLLHHDGLRSRFERDGDRWLQVIPPPGECRAVVSRIDLSGVPAEARLAELEAACARLQAGLDFERGPVLRIVHFHLGPDVPGRLLIVAGHLVVDGYALSIAQQDLGTAYRQLAAGEAVVLPPKSTPYREYAGRLAAQARSGALQEDLRYWLGLPWADAGRLAPDLAHEPGANTMGSQAVATAELTAEETASLFQDVLPGLGVETQDALMAALVQSLVPAVSSEWVSTTVIAHGRDIDLGPGVDLSRTVGCVAFGHPELLRGNRHLPPPAAVRAIAEQRRRIPRGGYSFEVLQLMGDADVQARMRDLPRPEIQFNNVGQTAAWGRRRTSDRGLLLGPAPERLGPLTDPRAIREPLLYYRAAVDGGRLEILVAYSRNVHRRETAERLVTGYVSWLRRLVEQGAGGGR